MERKTRQEKARTLLESSYLSFLGLDGLGNPDPEVEVSIPIFDAGSLAGRAVGLVYELLSNLATNQGNVGVTAAVARIHSRWNRCQVVPRGLLLDQRQSPEHLSLPSRDCRKFPGWKQTYKKDESSSFSRAFFFRSYPSEENCPSVGSVERTFSNSWGESWNSGSGAEEARLPQQAPLEEGSSELIVQSQMFLSSPRLVLLKSTLRSVSEACCLFCTLPLFKSVPDSKVNCVTKAGKERV